MARHLFKNLTSSSVIFKDNFYDFRVYYDYAYFCYANQLPFFQCSILIFDCLHVR